MLAIRPTVYRETDRVKKSGWKMAKKIDRGAVKHFCRVWFSWSLLLVTLFLTKFSSQCYLCLQSVVVKRVTNRGDIQKMNSLLPQHVQVITTRPYSLLFGPPHVGHWPACSLVLCPGRQLVCLKPAHRDAQTRTQRHRGEKGEREGGREGHIHRPRNRAGLAQVRASLPGHLSGIWVFQGSDVKVSTMWMTGPMTRLLSYAAH